MVVNEAHLRSVLAEFAAYFCRVYKPPAARVRGVVAAWDAAPAA